MFVDPSTSNALKIKERNKLGAALKKEIADLKESNLDTELIATFEIASLVDLKKFNVER